MTNSQQATTQEVERFPTSCRSAAICYEAALISSFNAEDDAAVQISSAASSFSAYQQLVLNSAAIHVLKYIVTETGQKLSWLLYQCKATGWCLAA